MQETTTNMHCRYCARPLKGRSDKKFCDDQCRNTFNNQQKRERNELVQALNKRLLKNRAVLEAVWERKQKPAVLKREQLLLAGYQFQYHTHTHINKRGLVYRYCYEYGLLQLEGSRYLVVKERVNRLFELTHPDLPLGNRIVGSAGDESAAGFTAAMAHK